MTWFKCFLVEFDVVRFWFSWRECCSSMRTPSAGSHSFLWFHRSVLKCDPDINSLNNPVTRWSPVVFIDKNQADSCLTCIFVCVCLAATRLLIQVLIKLTLSPCGYHLWCWRWTFIQQVSWFHGRVPSLDAARGVCEQEHGFWGLFFEDSDNNHDDDDDTKLSVRPGRDLVQ